MEGSVLQGMMQNPDMLRSMLQANPAIREVQSAEHNILQEGNFEHHWFSVEHIKNNEAHQHCSTFNILHVDPSFLQTF